MACMGSTFWSNTHGTNSAARPRVANCNLGEFGLEMRCASKGLSVLCSQTVGTGGEQLLDHKTGAAHQSIVFRRLPMYYRQLVREDSSI